MSQLSPDGRYLWDGVQWVPNLPPDPVAQAPVAPAPASMSAAPPAAGRNQASLLLLVASLALALVLWVLNLLYLANYASTESDLLSAGFWYENWFVHVSTLFSWVAVALAVAGTLLPRRILPLAVVALVVSAAVCGDLTMDSLYRIVDPY